MEVQGFDRKITRYQMKVADPESRWPPPQTAEYSSRCDFCPRRDVVALDVVCVHEHIGTIIVCREKHEALARDPEGWGLYCRPCDQAHQTTILHIDRDLNEREHWARTSSGSRGLIPSANDPATVLREAGPDGATPENLHGAGPADNTEGVNPAGARPDSAEQGMASDPAFRDTGLIVPGAW